MIQTFQVAQLEIQGKGYVAGLDADQLLVLEGIFLYEVEETSISTYDEYKFRLGIVTLDSPLGI